jgi:hypothetical protein
VDDATNAEVSCTFHAIPGVSWTTSEARTVARYFKRIIDVLP